MLRVLHKSSACWSVSNEKDIRGVVERAGLSEPSAVRTILSRSGTSRRARSSLATSWISQMTKMTATARTWTKENQFRFWPNGTVLAEENLPLRREPEYRLSGDVHPVSPV